MFACGVEKFTIMDIVAPSKYLIILHVYMLL